MDFVTREYNGTTTLVAKFNGEIVAIGEDVLTMSNAKKTPYHVITIKDTSGVNRNATFCPTEKNPVDKLKVGEEASCELSYVIGDETRSAYFRVLWLASAPRVTADDLNHDIEEILRTAQPEVELA